MVVKEMIVRQARERLRFRPIAGRVVIQASDHADEQEETRKSGIVIPDSAKAKSCEGIVRAVGPGRWETLHTPFEDSTGTIHFGYHVPMELAVGDRVLFLRWSAQKITVDSEVVYSLDESMVEGVADPDAEIEFTMKSRG